VRARPSHVGERAVPVTALALERERSSRLRTELERAAAAERELRGEVVALERVVHDRRDAERRIEAALARVRAEFDAAKALAEGASADVPASAAAPPGADAPPMAEPAAGVPPAADAPPPAEPADEVPTPPTPSVGPPSVARAPGAPTVDAERLEAARTRLRAATPAEAQDPPPDGPPTPWLPRTLRELAREDPATAGRVLAGLLPAQGLVSEGPLRYDVVLAGRGCLAVDVGEAGASVRALPRGRGRRETDVRVATDDAGLARLLLGRRGLRRRARVRGVHRRVRELRRLAQAPLALRDLARAGVALDPALALLLAARAIDPVDTLGHRFTIAHAPLAGGPADAWLQIQGAGGPPLVLGAPPGEAPAATLRCTRGALLALLAGVAPVPGERGVVDGEAHALTLVRTWIARTEFPKR
jgi:hypothetical protein